MKRLVIRPDVVTSTKTGAVRRRKRQVVRDMTAAEIEAHTAAALVEELKVPNKVTKLQMVRAMREAGVTLTHANADAKDDWEAATRITRDDAVLTSSIHNDAATLDGLFRQAGKLSR